MPTFLQLCVKTRRECDLAGTGPTTVLSQTGKLEKIVNWVADAYTEIQGRYPNWRWMRKPFTVNTVASTDTYAYTACTDTEAGTVISRFKRWWADDECRRFTIYLSSGGVSGQRWLIWMPYDIFKVLYKFGQQQSQTGAPIHVSVDDNNRIVLGPNPDAVYVVGGDFQRSAQVLAADATVPEMPADYHMLAVYVAMRKYGASEAAVEVFSRGQLEGGRMLRQLELDQLPQMCLGGPLA